MATPEKPKATSKGTEFDVNAFYITVIVIMVLLVVALVITGAVLATQISNGRMIHVIIQLIFPSARIHQQNSDSSTDID
jgi:hypothetical protein